jgi:acetylornithine deacetylase/succinyl-diaminopimelate desuccinylase-like protein
MTEWLQRALQAVDATALVKLTADLVRFSSVTPPGSEEPIARFVADRFRAHGLGVELQEVISTSCRLATAGACHPLSRPYGMAASMAAVRPT